MFDAPIPNPWIKAKLPEVADLNMGQSPSNNDVNETGEGIAFFQGKAEFGKLFPTVRKFCTAPPKVAQANDILLSVRAPVGPTNLADRETAIGRGLAAISVSKDNFNYKYLLHYFRNIEPWMSQQGTGTTFKAISGQFLKELDCVVPPLAEQKVIADKLDSLLAQVETTKARLERISKILKTFRQSVLVAAVSGKLISVAEPILITVGDVTTDIRYGTSKKCDYKGGQTPVIRIPNIGDRKLDISDLKYADFTERELKTLALKAGDILVIRSNGSLDLVAKPALVDKKCEGFLYAGYLIRIRCNEEKVLPSFLLSVMSSRVVRDVVEIGARSTSGVNNINSKELASFEFVLPSIEEQAKIILRVEELFAFADTIEQKANAALERVTNLTQSILAKAFRGELTADWRAANPDLISGENSAEALLEKIKAEREAIKNQSNTKRITVKKHAGNQMSKQIIKVIDALKEANEPLSGQQLLAAAGYPSDSSTDLLEQFFLDIRDALSIQKTIVKLDRGDNEQDWFALSETVEMNKE